VALKLSKISKSFGPTIALDGVDLELREGEVHALIGENGAGKSTLMNVIAGSLHPDQGTMEIHGKPYAPSNPLDARTHGIALIHQELSLCPHLSVAENVLMGIESSHLGWLDRDRLIARTNDVLKTFHHADIRPEKRVGDLSVAARQIVEISRALAANDSPEMRVRRPRESKRLGPFADAPAGLRHRLVVRRLAEDARAPFDLEEPVAVVVADAVGDDAAA